MSPIVWANLLLAVPFVLAWVGIPLWMVVRRPETAPDFSEAHAYLAATRQLPAVHRIGSPAETAAQPGPQPVAIAA